MLVLGPLLFIPAQLLSVFELAYEREGASLIARTVRLCGDDK